MRIVLIAVCLFGSMAFAAEYVPAGSRIYIEPADGFDTFLTAALDRIRQCPKQRRRLGPR
jgi:hypothetical protein